MDGVTIRTATAADTAAIGKLWEKLVLHHNQLNPDLPRAAEDGARLYARSLANRLYDSHTRVYVADFDEQVIGYVLGVVVDLVPEMFEQEAAGFLADIYVDETYRGKGVGRGLVEALVSWFQQNNLRHFEWHVASSNADGLAFWRAMNGRDIMLRMRADIPQDKQND